MEIQSQTNRTLIFVIVNIILLLVLYNIPIDNGPLSNSICIYKCIFGKECWNCGMTRAFLSVLHLDFKGAINFNSKVIFVFPMTVSLYLYSWYKYIFKEKTKKMVS